MLMPLTTKSQILHFVQNDRGGEKDRRRDEKDGEGMFPLPLLFLPLPSRERAGVRGLVLTRSFPTFLTLSFPMFLTLSFPTFFIGNPRPG